MRILYVEDNMANIQLVRRVARAGNHEVITYMDGEEALIKYESIEPDLILMDIQLAGEMSGLDVVRQIRSNGHSVPIIAVTAYAMVGDRERCIEAGCTDYIAKPLPIHRLIELMTYYDPAKSDAETCAKAQAVAPSAETASTTAVLSDSADETPASEPVQSSDPKSVNLAEAVISESAAEASEDAVVIVEGDETPQDSAERTEESPAASASESETPRAAQESN